jgi:hypothetical protein
MPDLKPLRENESGPYGELISRPNPHGLAVLQIPPFEEVLPFLQSDLARELSPEEIDVQRQKAPAIVVSREAAEKMLALRAKRAPSIGTGGGPRSPRVSGSYDEMPTDSANRAESAIESLGQHLFWLRNHLVERLRQRIESEESRKQLATVRRKEFDAVAALDLAGREAALSLARKAIDMYLQEILVLLTGTGDSLRFGDDHAINYLLTLQVKEVETDEVVEEFHVNRSGKKVFYDYFGRWLSRYSDLR